MAGSDVRCTQHIVRHGRQSRCPGVVVVEERPVSADLSERVRRCTYCGHEYSSSFSMRVKVAETGGKEG
jgi:hypothetical protein